AFTRRTAMAGAGSEKSARLLFCLSFDAPFFDPRDQHSGVKQAGFCLGRGRGGGSRDPEKCAFCRPGFRPDQRNFLILDVRRHRTKKKRGTAVLLWNVSSLNIVESAFLEVGVLSWPRARIGKAI